jgi:ankyrin repeat protein
VGRGRTPLHSAANGGHIECCKLLIEHGAKWSVPDMRKRLPLHEALTLPPIYFKIIIIIIITIG